MGEAWDVAVDCQIIEQHSISLSTSHTSPNCEPVPSMFLLYADRSSEYFV